MAWFKLDADIFDHPKTLDLAELWGLDVETTVGKLTRFWAWCLKYTITGLIEIDHAGRVNRLLGASHPASHAVSYAVSHPASNTASPHAPDTAHSPPPNWLDCMVKSGFVDVTDDGKYYRVHGWLEHMGEWLQRRFNRTPEKWRSIREIYQFPTSIPPQNTPTAQPVIHAVSHAGSHAVSHTGSPKEEKRIEEKRREDRILKPKTCVFAPPTPDQVAAYCLEHNIPIDHQRFLDYYTANGWKVGRNPMKDWKAAVRNWFRSQKTQYPNGGPNVQHRPTQAFSGKSAQIESSAPLLGLQSADGV